MKYRKIISDQEAKSTRPHRLRASALRAFASRCRGAVLCTVLLAAATPALAVDGVLEINQACALNSGCFPGDAPGYPVTITGSAGRSYRLTSDLIVQSASFNAITSIPAGAKVNDITIDLNGFTVEGPDSSTNGIQISAGDNWEIRNGTVKGFVNGIQQSTVSNGHRVIGVRVMENSNSGISLANGSGHLVEDCSVMRNGSAIGHVGIRLGTGSLARGNTVFENAGLGLLLDQGTGYVNNVINGNTGTVFRGVELGSNVCDGNAICP